MQQYYLHNHIFWLPYFYGINGFDGFKSSSYFSLKLKNNMPLTAYHKVGGLKYKYIAQYEDDTMLK